MKVLCKSRRAGFQSINHLLILVHLAQTENANLTDLANLTGISSAAITGLIDALEAQGLAERCRTATDRRVIHIVLSSKGRDTITRILA